MRVGNATQCVCDENWTWIGILNTMEPNAACSIYVPWSNGYEIAGALFGLLPGILLVRAWAVQRAKRGSSAGEKQRLAVSKRQKKAKEAKGKLRPDAPEHMELEASISQLSLQSMVSVLGENPLEEMPGRGSNYFYICLSHLFCVSLVDKLARIPFGSDCLIVVYSVINLVVMIVRLLQPEYDLFFLIDFS